MTHETEEVDGVETGPFGFLGKIGPASSLISSFDWSHDARCDCGMARRSESGCHLCR